MNRELVGEPAVSAFLRSVCQNLDAHIRRMDRMKTSPIYYDPRKDLKQLKEKLTSVQDVLVDGEARRLGEESVDEWMDDLKDLLYDVEDIMDDLKSVSNVQVRVHELYLDSKEIENSLSVIVGRSEVLRKKVKGLKLKRGSGYALSGEPKVTRRTPETSSLVDKSEIIRGREEDKTIIVKKLLEVDDKGKKNYDVLCIVGMGGLGKTTLAQSVFNEPDIVKHFDVKSWVCISNVFDVARATRELIVNSDRNEDGSSIEPLDRLQRRLSEKVENKKFLFVLDDVWSSKEWEKMKLPFSSCANGSKILVTTRKKTIAYAFGNKDPYPLQVLDHEKSMELFRDKAFGDDDGEQEKVDLVEKIVRACGGVPLVVKVIGSMLQVADVEKWVAVSENTDHWVEEDDEIHPAIRFSYYDLPAFLKRCFEYLAVFPPDYSFDQDDVVRLWIADGLVQDMKGRMAEDIGNEYYSDLKARSLIQDDDRMHDIVHHLATTVSRKFCYKENMKESPASVRHAFVANLNAMHYEFLAQAPCLRTLIVKHFQSQNVFENTNRPWKKLRTLKIITGWKSAGRGTFINYLTHIRYLTIEGLDFKLLPDSLCMLDNLQFLKLSRNVPVENFGGRIDYLSNLRHLEFCSFSITSLHESICTLSQLQVLKLMGHLKQLPEDIGNLRKLQTLDLSHTLISILPESICALSQLQVLNLDECRHFKQLPEDIGNLRSLRKLGLFWTLIPSLPESICALSQLQDLNLHSCRNLKQLPVDIGNLKSLRTLELSHSSISSLPESIWALSQLQDLNLQFWVSLNQSPKDIGNLMNLRRLYLAGTQLIVPISILSVIAHENVYRPLTVHIGSLERDGGLQYGPNIIIGGVEEALMADLKSKNVSALIFCCSQAGDEEMAMKIMEALEPHHALQKLTFSNYWRDKFPRWIMANNICFSNLTFLRMERLNKICEMVDMEFVSLEELQIEKCPILRMISMATPKLRTLRMWNCGELEAACVQFLPSLSDKAGTHSIVSQLEMLKCAYNIFEYFFEKLQTANSKWNKLSIIKLRGEGRRVASLPGGWPSMMDCLEEMIIEDIGPGKFQFLPDADQSTFPSSLSLLRINGYHIEERLPHRSYTLTSDGKVEGIILDQAPALKKELTRVGEASSSSSCPPASFNAEESGIVDGVSGEDAKSHRLVQVSEDAFEQGSKKCCFLRLWKWRY